MNVRLNQLSNRMMENREYSIFHAACDQMYNTKLRIFVWSAFLLTYIYFGWNYISEFFNFSSIFFEMCQQERYKNIFTSKGFSNYYIYSVSYSMGFKLFNWNANIEARTSSKYNKLCPEWTCDRNIVNLMKATAIQEKKTIKLKPKKLKSEWHMYLFTPLQSQMKQFLFIFVEEHLICIHIATWIDINSTNINFI